MGRFLIAAALALIPSPPLQAGVEITATGDRLDVTAAEAPVSEVLDGLARKTRMKVVYEGAVPRTLVTVELRGRTPAQAVLGVLEGLGLNYALVLDVSGTEVETLMIVGTGALTASAGTVHPARSARNEAPPDDQEETIVDSEGPPTDVEASIPGVPHDVPKVDEKAKPAPAFLGPLNPTNAFPGASPFAPGPLPLVRPSPSPNPPSSR
ncbi:MAG TPA: hypothetical protein VGB42_11515 [Candidatus Thermoplasmatota archaeon]